MYCGQESSHLDIIVLARPTNQDALTETGSIALFTLYTLNCQTGKGMVSE